MKPVSAAASATSPAQSGAHATAPVAINRTAPVPQPRAALSRAADVIQSGRAAPASADERPDALLTAASLVSPQVGAAIRARASALPGGSLSPVPPVSLRTRPTRLSDEGARAGMTPRQAREMFRSGAYTGPTAAFSAGFVQANLVIVPASAADDFEAYCRANPKPCPLLERLDAGDPSPKRLATGADLRTDIPRYRIYSRGGAFTEATDVKDLFTHECVAFLLGCSFTFEEALSAAGMVPRHVEEGVNVPMYRTERQTKAAGAFDGPLVVSMRPIAADRVAEAYAVTEPYSAVHGAPVYHGDPASLGIKSLHAPEWGDPVQLRNGEVPVFWACGVTSQEAVTSALNRSALPWAITHAPGHMFISDLRGTDLIDRQAEQTCGPPPC